MKKVAVERKKKEVAGKGRFDGHQKRCSPVPISCVFYTRVKCLTERR